MYGKSYYPYFDIDTETTLSPEMYLLFLLYVQNIMVRV